MAKRARKVTDDQSTATSRANLITSKVNPGRLSEFHANSRVDDSGVEIHWKQMKEYSEDQQSFVGGDDGPVFGQENRGFSGGFSHDGFPSVHGFRGESGHEGDQEVPDWLHKALAGPSSAAPASVLTTSTRDIIQRVPLSAAPVDDATLIGRSSIYSHYPDTDGINPSGSLPRNQRLDDMNTSFNFFGDTAPPVDSNYPESMSPFSPFFPRLSAIAQPFTTPGPHVKIHLHSRQSNTGNHSRFLPLAQPEYHASGYNAPQMEFQAAHTRPWEPQTPVKPFSKPFIQASANLRLEDRYAGTRKTDFVVRPHTNLHAITEEQEIEVSSAAHHMMPERYSCSTPAIEENYYVKDTNSSAYTVQDGYPSSEAFLPTDIADEESESIHPGSSRYYDEPDTKGTFERYNSDRDPGSPAMIMEPRHGYHSETSFDSFGCYMSEQHVCDSFGPLWTTLSSSQTISAVSACERTNSAPPQRHTTQNSSESITPGEEGILAGQQEIKGPCSNMALDVEALEAAAAANMRKDEGFMQSFHVPDNVTPVMNVKTDEPKVVSSSPVSQFAL